MTLDECKVAARQGGCYVVTKYDPKHGEIYILYRKNGERIFNQAGVAFGVGGADKKGLRVVVKRRTMVVTSKGVTNMQTEIRVLGGLPITIEFSPCRAEPDVGIMSDYVEEWYVVEIAGRPLRKGEKCQWLYDRIEAKKGEEDRILQACFEAMDNNEPDYDYDEPY